MAIPLPSVDALRSLVPFSTKLPNSEEDRGVVAHFMGIPVGFQFGTAAGLTGISALLVDILTDPVTWLLPGVGELTRAGRAGQIITKGSKLLPMAERALEAGAKTLPEVQAFWKTPLLRAAQMETRSFQVTSDVLKPFLEAGDAKGATKALKDMLTMGGDAFTPHGTDVRKLISTLQNGGTEALKGHLGGLIGQRQNLQSLVTTALSAGDKATALEAMKAISRNAPTGRWKALFGGEMRGAWKAAFDEAKAGRAISPLAETARKQAAAGQRALLSIVAPGMGRIPLIKGEGVVGAVAEAAKKVGFGARAIKAAEVLDKPLGDLGASPFTLQESITAASGAIDRSAKEALTAPSLDISGADLLKNRAELQKAHTEVGAQLGATLETEFRSTMKAQGLTHADDLLRVNELAQNVTKYVGKDGSLTEAARAAGLTEKHQLVAESLLNGFTKFGDMAKSHGIINALIPNYMRRSVEVLKGKEGAFAEAMGTYSRKASETSTFWSPALERKIPAWDQLMALEKAGIVTVEKDPGKLLKSYVTSLGQAQANAGFVDGMALSYVPAEIVGKGGKQTDVLLHLLVPGGKNDRFAARTGKYVSLSRKAEPSILALTDQIAERTGRKAFHRSDHVWVHKDIVDKIRAVIDPGFATTHALPATATGPEKALAAAMQVNAIAKRFLLFPGTVHLVNLTEKALVTNGWEGFKDIIGKVLPGLVKPAGARSYLEVLPEMEDAIRAGLKLDAPIDAEIDTFQKALKNVSQKLPVTKPVVNAVRTMEQWASGKLWGQYHAPMKLYSYQELVTRALEKYPNLDAKALKAKVATHVNQSFGGGNLEKMFGSKKGQQLMRLFFLAPDWLIGNTKIATDVFANLFSKERALLPAGAVLAEDARAFFARQYALRTGLMLAVAGNFANLAFTGHFMWDNEDATRIQLPGADQDGKPIYLGMFDQFMMPFELAASPFQFTARKLGPVPRIAIGEALSRNFFGQPIVTTKDGPLSNVMKRVGFAIENVAPISVQTALGVQYGKIPAAARALSFVGLPVRGSSANAKQDPEAAQQAAIEKAVSNFAEAHSLMMKSDGYRRGLDRQRDLLPVAPTSGLLPVAQ